MDASSFKVPAFIILGGLLLAGIIFATAVPAADVGGISRGKTAFVYGEKNAPVRIVEFSDLQCPFCARLHVTLEQVVARMGGQVSWEYRHFPLASHPRAMPAAEFAECVGKLKGSDTFFVYLSTLFGNQNDLSDEYLLSEALSLGVSEEKLRVCLTDTATKEQIAADQDLAIALGGQGTPFSLVLFPGGKYEVVRGALPEEYWISLIQNYRESVQ